MKKTALKLSLLALGTMLLCPMTTPAIGKAAQVNDLNVYLTKENCKHTDNQDAGEKIDFFSKNSVDDCHFILESHSNSYQDENHNYIDYTSSGEGFLYEKDTNTLTLDNFTGGRLHVRADFDDGVPLAFHLNLKGDNVLTNQGSGEYALRVGRNMNFVALNIKGEGTLTLNQNQEIDFAALQAADITIQGKSKVYLNTATANGPALSAYNLIIDSDSSLSATANGTAAEIGSEAKIDGILTATAKQPQFALRVPTIQIGSNRMIVKGKNAKTAKPFPLNQWENILYTADKTANYIAILPKTKVVSDTVPSIAKSEITSLTSTAKKQAVVQWKSLKNTSGYELYYAASKKGSYQKLATLNNASDLRYTAKNLKSGSTYYFKVRGFQTKKGATDYGSYSEVKWITIK